MAVKLVKLNSGQILITLQHYVAGIVFSRPNIYIPYIPPSAWESSKQREREKIAKKLEKGGRRGTDACTTPSPNKKVLRRTLEGGSTVEKEAEINNSGSPHPPSREGG